MKALQNEADERLLVEAAQSDPRCFGAFYERNFERVYAYIMRRVGNRAEAEDLTSEVFHDALANLGQFKWRGIPFAAWLYQIAANAIADRWRRAGQERTSAGWIDLEPVRGPAENIERQAMLFRLVRTLPAEQRRVIEMRFGEEKSIRQIAEELGRSEGAVKQLQFRGIEKLRVQAGAKKGKKLGGRNG